MNPYNMLTKDARHFEQYQSFNQFGLSRMISVGALQAVYAAERGWKHFRSMFLA
ncbi:MAG: hypothetical protein HN725_04925 [Alphaproteobacteria bacterium]|jgi:hypothetical protein|nr:hypothetical protein [Alphaproteobacteria bacterium]MBT4083703.1 hypothetical protein [Alphaproteobacteria bacterium]MBT4545225.1 hypothetical protein [Alphaproteobacteria bacterium]MBT7744613.1 hypothetical protein [Alphaproteobacteria bacterium]